MQLKKILVTTDFSSAADRAVQRALALASRDGAELRLMHAVPPLLVFSADALSHEAGLSDGFVGTVLVGFTTSFPEMAAAVAAVRLGAIDLAVGNIFGSNAFNMTVLLLMDVAYRGKSVLASVSSTHIISAVTAVIALALGIMAILSRTHSRLWVARMLAGFIVLTYGTGVFLLARTA